jgi:hypothetical protein
VQEVFWELFLSPFWQECPYLSGLFVNLVEREVVDKKGGLELDWLGAINAGLERGRSQGEVEGGGLS